MDQMNVAQQEQAVDHAGYLMAYDKKEKRAKGVTGIDATGTSRWRRPLGRTATIL